MKLNHRAISILSGIALLYINQSAWAVMPSNRMNQSDTTHLATAKNTIQRGGMITAINISQHTISVDKIAYSLLTTSIPIHTTGIQSHENQAKLEVGTLIRFNTVKEGLNGREAISEIWIVPTKTPYPKK